MSQIGQPGQLVDPVNGGDVAADGTLLSVAEIQQRFREERAGRGLAAAPRPASARPAATAATLTAPLADDPALAPAPVLTARAVATVSEAPAADASTPARPDTPRRQRPQATPKTSLPNAAARTSAAERGSLDIPSSWVRVLAGHSGAGASTTALSIADAAAASGRPSQVIEAAPASRSGLVGAASRELDVDDSRAWRRGTRPHAATSVPVTITRRAEDRQPSAWPATTGNPGELLVAVDLGLVSADTLASVTGGPIVVACRASIPGVRSIEQLLDRLDDATVVVAMLGSHRWPGEVTASCGSRLRALRAAGRVVTVPLDRHLAVTGPTHVPLPKAVLSAGQALLGLIDAARPGSYGAPPVTARSAPRARGTRQ